MTCKRRREAKLIRRMILISMVLALGATPAMGHHESSIPSQRILSRIYPDIAARKLPSPVLRDILRTRWNNKHPAALEEHYRKVRLFNMFDRVATCESHNTWDISTGNGYYGGLQFDRLFARTYDPVAYATLGTPNHWSRERQINAAIRAYKSRGLTPWPICGLKRLGYRPVN